MRRFLCGSALLTVVLAACPSFAEDQAEFITNLAGRESVSYADAVRGIAMILDGGASVPGFEPAQGVLQEKQIVNKKWSVDAGATLKKGKLAYMLFNAAELQKGLGDVLFGLSEKTAVEECHRNDLMAQGRPEHGMEDGMSLVLSLQQLAARLDKKHQIKTADLVNIDFDAVKIDLPPEKKEAQDRLLALLTAGLKTTSAEVSGTVVALRGPVWIRSGDKPWAPASDGAVVAAGTKLFTGVNSEAELGFPDGTIVLMKPFTELELIFAGSGTCKEGTFYIIRAASNCGTVRAQVGAKSFLSCVQVGSTASYITALDGAFEQTVAGKAADATHAGSKGRISVVPGSW